MIFQLGSCHNRMFFFFFFNDTATTEIYTLSLHDALPISEFETCEWEPPTQRSARPKEAEERFPSEVRSEEHTSELQSRLHLVCRLLLEKKKKTDTQILPRAPDKPHRHRAEERPHDVETPF